MKKIILLIFILTFSIFSCKAQNPITEVEYNYITKGIKIQEESGLDTKKGYIIKNLFTFPENAPSIIRKTTFKAIYRETDKKPFAFLCIYKNTSNGFEDYICFPNVDPAGTFCSKTNEILTEYDENGKLAIIWGLVRLSAFNTNQ